MSGPEGPGVRKVRGGLTLGCCREKWGGVEASVVVEKNETGRLVGRVRGVAPPRESR